MAEEHLPEFFLHAKGHNLDPGPFTLDLYRLLCLVLADQRVAKLALKSGFISRLQEEYLKTELARILISSAVALRIRFDQEDPRAFAHLKTDCGKLYPNWAKQKKKVEVLTLREACNKIIHATGINFDVVNPDAERNYDYEGVHLRPYLYLYGTKASRRWRAQLSIINFVKWGTAVFWK